jgi:hypothetical protein
MLRRTPSDPRYWPVDFFIEVEARAQQRMAEFDALPGDLRAWVSELGAEAMPAAQAEAARRQVARPEGAELKRRRRGERR